MTQTPGVQRDKVLLYLISVNLTEHESAYRGLLQVAGAGANPTTRHFTIAAMALMLQMSQIPLPVIMTVVNCLRDQSDDQIKVGLVAVLNGSHIVVSKGLDANTMFLIDTLEVVEQQPKYLLTSSMYFVKNVWQQADDILSGRA